MVIHMLSAYFDMVLSFFIIKQWTFPTSILRPLILRSLPMKSKSKKFIKEQEEATATAIREDNAMDAKRIDQGHEDEDVAIP